MISKGTLVKYVGEEKKTLWKGRLLMVHERKEDKIVVWDQQISKSEYSQLTIPVKDVEEVC